MPPTVPSRPLTLTDLPDSPMTHVVKYVDFRTKMTLRKVCHSLESQMTRLRDAHFKSICIRITPDYVNVILSENDDPKTIFYLRGPNGCVVYYEGKSSRVDNYTNFDSFFRDIAWILVSQASKLRFFAVFIKGFPASCEDVFNFLGKILKGRSSPLKVKSCYLEARSQNQLLEILPGFDSNILESITVCDPHHKKNKIQTTELANLPQWKNCKILMFEDCLVSGRIKNFLNFASLSICFKTITSRHLISLKKAFFHSRTPCHFQIGFINFPDEQTFLSLPEFARDGREKQKKRWFFRLPNRVMILHIYIKKENNDSSFEFEVIAEERKPRNAPLFV